MSLKDFQIIKKLGEGSYSSVFQVKRLSDGEHYALKKVKMEELSEKEKTNALNEIRILASIRHPNIIQYREAFIDDASSTLCLVMEFANSGDIYGEIIRLQRESSFADEEWVWRLVIQMVRGLKALHTLKILHRDIKTANIFLSDEMQIAKLGDMNVSKVAKKGMLSTQTGTPYYASPEVWRDLPYDNKSDIWSLGCVIYEIIALRPPFRAETMEGLFKKILAGKYPRIPPIFSNDMSRLIKSLLQVQPHLRPSCDKILEMPLVYQRIVKYFPEAQPENQYENILLRTIKLPKNLLYLTSHLPQPTYEDRADVSQLSLPDATKKRNTTIQAKSDRGNRFNTIQRGLKTNMPQDLNRSELQISRNQHFSQAISNESDAPEDNLSDNDYQMNQQFPAANTRARRAQQLRLKVKKGAHDNLDSIGLINKIVETKSQIDDQLTKLKNGDAHMIEEKKMSQRNSPQRLRMQTIEVDQIQQTEIDESLSHYARKPKRIVMEQGVYDARIPKIQKGQIDFAQKESSLIANIGNSLLYNNGISERSRSQVPAPHQIFHQQGVEPTATRIVRDRSNEQSHENLLMGSPGIFPSIFAQIGVNSNARNQPSNVNYLRLQQAPPQPNQQQNFQSIYQPANSSKYLQYINKPQVGINQDRLNNLALSERDQQMRQQQHHAISHNRNPVPTTLSNQHSNVDINQQPYGEKYGAVSSLAVGNRIDYFNRLYPQF